MSESNLKDYVENISDDFQSTFSYVDKTTLANMLGHSQTDFIELEKIIKNYIPNAKVTYEKIESMPLPSMPDYGMYLVRIT